MVWILAVVGIMAVILLLVIVYAWKNKEKRHDTDYKAFFYMGLVWIIGSAAYMILMNAYDMIWLLSTGIVFFILGLANKDKWGKQKKMSRKGRERITIMLIVGILVLVLGILAFFLYAL